VGAPTQAQVVARKTPADKAELVEATPVSAPEVPPDVEAPAPPTAVPERVAALDAQPPPEVVLVHVRAGQGSSFVISAFEKREQGGFAEREIESDAAGDDLFSMRLEPEEFYGMVDLLGDNPAIRKFVKWLEGRRAAHPGGLFLVIQEHTTTNVPWEMLRLGDSFLGAQVNVARWEGAELEASELGTPPEQQGGGGDVVAYVAQGIPERTTLTPGQREAFERALQVIHGGRPLRLVQELIDILGTPREGVGVLYLLCHGLIAAKVQQSRLYAEPETHYPQEQLPLLKLRTLEMELLARSRAVVFLDACTGGQVVQGASQLPARTRVGFPQAFLNKGARGVIGAVADLDVEYAVKLAHDFVELAREQPRPVAELLRELRARAAADLRNARDPERWTRWYHTFLYVYYGHPLATLSLGRGQEAGIGP
jgi:hypothetical protein